MRSVLLFGMCLPSGGASAVPEKGVYDTCTIYRDREWALDWVGGLHEAGCGATVFLKNATGDDWFCVGGIIKSEDERMDGHGRKFRRFFLTTVFDKQGVDHAKADNKVSLDYNLFKGFGGKATTMKAFDVSPKEYGSVLTMLGPGKFLAKTNGYRRLGNSPTVEAEHRMSPTFVPFDAPEEDLPGIAITERQRTPQCFPTQQTSASGSRRRNKQSQPRRPPREEDRGPPVGSSRRKECAGPSQPSSRQDEGTPAITYKRKVVTTAPSPTRQKDEGGASRKAALREISEGLDEETEDDTRICNYEEDDGGDGENDDAYPVVDEDGRQGISERSEGSVQKRKRQSSTSPTTTTDKHAAKKLTVAASRQTLRASQEAVAESVKKRKGLASTRATKAEKRPPKRKRIADEGDSGEDAEGVPPGVVSEQTQPSANTHDEAIDTTRCFFLEFDEDGFAKKKREHIEVDVTKILPIPEGDILFNHRTLDETLVQSIYDAIHNATKETNEKWDITTFILTPIVPNRDGSQGRRITPEQFDVELTHTYNWYAVAGQHTVEAINRLIKDKSPTEKVYGLRSYSHVCVVYFDDDTKRGYPYVSTFDNTREERSIPRSVRYIDLPGKAERRLPGQYFLKDNSGKKVMFHCIKARKGPPSATVFIPDLTPTIFKLFDDMTAREKQVALHHMMRGDVIVTSRTVPRGRCNMADLVKYTRRKRYMVCMFNYILFKAEGRSKEECSADFFIGCTTILERYSKNSLTDEKWTEERDHIPDDKARKVPRRLGGQDETNGENGARLEATQGMYKETPFHLKCFIYEAIGCLDDLRVEVNRISSSACHIFWEVGKRITTILPFEIEPKGLLTNNEEVVGTARGMKIRATIRDMSTSPKCVPWDGDTFFKLYAFLMTCCGENWALIIFAPMKHQKQVMQSVYKWDDVAVLTGSWYRHYTPSTTLNKYNNIAVRYTDMMAIVLHAENDNLDNIMVAPKLRAELTNLNVEEGEFVRCSGECIGVEGDIDAVYSWMERESALGYVIRKSELEIAMNEYHGSHMSVFHMFVACCEHLYFNMKKRALSSRDYADLALKVGNFSNIDWDEDTSDSDLDVSSRAARGVPEGARTEEPQGSTNADAKKASSSLGATRASEGNVEDRMNAKGEKNGVPTNPLDASEGIVNSRGNTAGGENGCAMTPPTAGPSSTHAPQPEQRTLTSMDTNEDEDLDMTALTPKLVPEKSLPQGFAQDPSVSYLLQDKYKNSSDEDWGHHILWHEGVFELCVFAGKWHMAVKIRDRGWVAKERKDAAIWHSVTETQLFRRVLKENVGAGEVAVAAKAKALFEHLRANKQLEFSTKFYDLASSVSYGSIDWKIKQASVVQGINSITSLKTQDVIATNTIVAMARGDAGCETDTRANASHMLNEQLRACVQQSTQRSAMGDSTMIRKDGDDMESDTLTEQPTRGINDETTIVGSFGSLVATIAARQGVSKMMETDAGQDGESQTVKVAQEEVAATTEETEKGEGSREQNSIIDMRSESAGEDMIQDNEQKDDHAAPRVEGDHEEDAQRPRRSTRVVIEKTMLDV
ncbi:hypothetical protein CBR_g39299 [Chara braunii]|uniref:Uncharacterized protein n=1 Tax=Chara braunii TaxID=69332 RepID=A0A388K158_CHABU|nr:hypothetical protein CBR_g39299 [Chara braunii]|eukprot:GBG63755.1 hypothetical protein CBR_g39299 [Chara braunii]